MLRHKWALGGALVAVLGVAGVLLSVGLATSDEGLAEPGPELSSRFSVFRSPAVTASEELAAGLARISDRVTDLSRSQDQLGTSVWEVRSGDTGQSIYLATSRTTICMIGWKPARYFSCSSAVAASDPDTPLVVSRGIEMNRTVVEALLPDEIRDVEVESAGGSRTTLPVVNNVATGVVAGHALTLNYEGQDGQRRALALGVPDAG